MSATLGELLSASMQRHAERVAIAHEDRAVTYRALHDRAARLAAALGARGLRPGDRLASWLTDGIESVDVFVAAALGGFTLVPINHRFRAAEARHVLEDSEARGLVFTTTLAQEVDAIAGLDSLPLRIAIGDGERPHDALALERVLESTAPLRRPVMRAPEDIAVIGYTSGTTGAPKGALCTHRAVTLCTRTVPYVQGMMTGGACTFVGSFSFVSALWGVLYPHLFTGGRLRLADPADLDGWLDWMERDQATYTWLASPLVRAFGRELRRRPKVLAPLRTVVHTGSKVPREFLEELVDVVGERLVETWGLTESVGPLTATTRADLHALRASGCEADDLLSSVGRPVPTAEVALLDSEGAIHARPGEEGELVARADTLFSGYLGHADAVFVHGAASDDRGGRDHHDEDGAGWFPTGDVGRLDEAGYVYIEDRRKDLIVSGGMNVYPAEVELALATLAGVVECAVFGVPHDRWGETVVAAVVREPGVALDERAVVDHVRARLASYKKPTRVAFLSELPRNASMKVQKQLLRERWPSYVEGD
ncbi:MAG: acyl--CoA ligase [Deltaproteobacteria bacterium]|jgi:acyl-CoA synthetase (AMP-forming)/AMP-acid ligase II|nr:acyl--CoA ligase [Deltaproteobacteria bacterium]